MYSQWNVIGSCDVITVCRSCWLNLNGLTVSGPVVGPRQDHHASPASSMISAAASAAGPPLVASPYPQSYLQYGQVIQAMPPHYHGQVQQRVLLWGLHFLFADQQTGSEDRSPSSCYSLIAEALRWYKRSSEPPPYALQSFLCRMFFLNSESESKCAASGLLDGELWCVHCHHVKSL